MCIVVDVYFASVQIDSKLIVFRRLSGTLKRFPSTLSVSGWKIVPSTKRESLKNASCSKLLLNCKAIYHRPQMALVIRCEDEHSCWVDIFCSYRFQLAARTVTVRIAIVSFSRVFLCMDTQREPVEKTQVVLLALYGTTCVEYHTSSI